MSDDLNLDFATDYDYVDLQHRFPGKFVIRRRNDVLLSADTYEELARTAETMDIDWNTVVVEFIERPDRIVAY